MSAPRRFVGLAVSGALLFATPARAALGDGDITPDSANSARFGVEQEGKQLSDRGEFQEAAELYWREGVRLKDPVLIIDSAEALRDQAAAERSLDVAGSALERIAPALDMLYFLREGSSSAAWQPIAPEYLGTVIARAEALATDVEALIAAIEDELRAPVAEADAGEPNKQKRGPARPGTVLIAAGGGALALGLGGAGLGVAGLALGARAQSEVEDPLVYEPEHSAAEERGKRANVLAGVGLAVAGVGIGAGVALIMLGLKKRKQADEGAGKTEAMLVPIWNEGGAGLGVVGRF
ncbi:MAG: hypothetical protein R6X02_33045 [Enhygromyxa sp.]